MKNPREYALEIVTHVKGADTERLTAIVSRAMNDAMDYAWREWCSRPRVPTSAEGSPASGLRLEDVIRAGFRDLTAGISTAFREALREAAVQPNRPGRLLSIKAAAPELGMTPDACRKWLSRADVPKGVIVRFGTRGIRIDVVRLKEWMIQGNPRP
jgi:hypothetical protein